MNTVNDMEANYLSENYPNLKLTKIARRKGDQISKWLENRTSKNGSTLQELVLVCLFYGKGYKTGFQFANLIAKKNNLEIKKIHLSQIVSKYIGETEKNLSKLFGKSENKNWILFFDEADALFESRTTVKESNNKYANQEVSYFFKSIKDFKGLIIFQCINKPDISDELAKQLNLVIRFSKDEVIQKA